MTVVDTHFKIEKNSQIASFISWKTFKSDSDFLEVLEDHLFWKIMEQSDESDLVEESDVFKVLSQNIWK